MPRTQVQSSEAGLTPPASPAPGHELARISVTASPLQRKATVSAPGDPLEREADHVADQVMRMEEPASLGPAPAAIQRKCTACESGEEHLHASRMPSEEAGAAPDAETAVRVAQQGGAELPKEVRSYFEPRFGHDFSAVRVHTDGEAAAAAHSVQAHAYTVGSDIVFGAGQYAPESAEGKRLLAHELTHVVQQSGGAEVSRLAISPQNLPTLAREKKDTAPPSSPEERPADLENDTWDGQTSGPLALPGHKFINDPYDHTVTVVRPDGSGTQYTYVTETTEEYGPREKLAKSLELSPMRVKALGFLDSKQGAFQETEAGRKTRVEKDHAAGEAAREEWARLSSANRTAYDTYKQALKEYGEKLKTLPKGGKTPPAPPRPGELPKDPAFTLCNNFPIELGDKLGPKGDDGNLGGFDPAVEGRKRGSWRTLETQPSGPKPGDVYSLGLPKDKNTIKHLGVFKSSRPTPDGKEIWTVVDGGQGTHASRQMIKERTRYYDPKTQILSTKLADAGQGAEERSLRGWIDIEEHFKKKDDKKAEQST